MTQRNAFQDNYPDQLAYCFGCGRLNEYGHQIKSFWDGDESICHFVPESFHIAVPGFVYGGLIASLIDCHGTGTAAAAAYRREGRSMDSLPAFRFLTASLHVDYRKPTPLNETLELRGVVDEITDRKAVVKITVKTKEITTATGTVVAVQVPDDLISKLFS